MIVDRFAAMGTQVVAHGDTEAALDEVREWFERVEDCCSRFRPDSELNRANTLAGQGYRPSRLFGEVLQAAEAVRSITGGLVDAGLGSRVVAWGYDRTFDLVEDRADAPAEGSPPNWHFDGELLHLAPGTELDLGGIAKGWAADWAVEQGLAAMVSAGGDLRSADASLVVDVVDAAGRPLAPVSVGIGGLATSSTARRNWKVAGQTVGHLIDPRTGEPAESPIVSAAVSAATALEAETGAKAVLLHGAGGLAWADRQPWVRRAVVEWHDGSVYAAGSEAA